MKPKWSPPIRRPRTWIVVGSGDVSRDTHLYGRWTGRTCWTPAKPSRARLASSSRSPIAPITVDSLPGATRPRAPIRSRRDRTSSTCSGAARRLITTSSCSSAESSAVITASSFGRPSIGPGMGAPPSWSAPAAASRAQYPRSSRQSSGVISSSGPTTVPSQPRTGSIPRTAPVRNIPSASPSRSNATDSSRSGIPSSAARSRTRRRVTPGRMRPSAGGVTSVPSWTTNRLPRLASRTVPSRSRSNGSRGARAASAPASSRRSAHLWAPIPPATSTRGELHAAIPARHDEGRLDGRDDDVGRRARRRRRGRRSGAGGREPAPRARSSTSRGAAGGHGAPNRARSAASRRARCASSSSGRPSVTSSVSNTPSAGSGRTSPGRADRRAGRRRRPCVRGSGRARQGTCGALRRRRSWGSLRGTRPSAASCSSRAAHGRTGSARAPRRRRPERSRP